MIRCLDNHGVDFDTEQKTIDIVLQNVFISNWDSVLLTRNVMLYFLLLWHYITRFQEC